MLLRRYKDKRDNVKTAAEIKSAAVSVNEEKAKEPEAKPKRSRKSE